MNLGAYLELARASNLPTCWSNVLVGCAFAGLAGWSLPVVVALLVAVSAFYVGGMALNDVRDAAFDARTRPGRPIPSGRISRRAAFWFGAACIGGALAVSAALGTETLVWGGALATAIVIYDQTHKDWTASAALMGLCRGLIYPWSASALGAPVGAAGSDRLLMAAAMLTVYITLVTLVAASEVGTPHARDRLLGWMIPVVSASFAIATGPDPAVLAMLAVQVAWLLRCRSHLDGPLRRPVRAVIGFLVGICLIDVTILVGMDRFALAAVAFGCFVASALAQRRISGS